MGKRAKNKEPIFDEFYQRAKMAEYILEGIISTKISSPIESSEPSGLSANLQPYSWITDSNRLPSYTINESNETSCIRQYVDREKTARSVERMAADASNLKWNVEEDGYKLLIKRSMH